MSDCCPKCGGENTMYLSPTIKAWRTGCEPCDIYVQTEHNKRVLAQPKLSKAQVRVLARLACGIQAVVRKPTQEKLVKLGLVKAESGLCRITDAGQFALLAQG